MLLACVQAWRCKQARALLCKLREELPQRKAAAAWQRMIKAAKAALWQQQLEAAARETAALVIQGAVRGWQVRRVTARQIAGIKRLQVGVSAGVKVVEARSRIQLFLCSTQDGCSSPAGDILMAWHMIVMITCRQPAAATVPLANHYQE